MRLLLAVCLCFTSTTLAFGDEKSKPVDEPIDDFRSPKPSVAAPVPDPIVAPVGSLRLPDQPVDDLGGDAPPFEGGAKAAASEWRPRLLVFLHATNNLPEIMKVLVAQKKSISVTAPLLSPSGNDDLSFGSSSIPRPESGEAVKNQYEEAEALTVCPGDSFLLYCDAVTVSVAQEGNTPTYQLECKSRVHICSEGFSVDADSASLTGGKCELENATLTCGAVSATAKQLTLTLPIRSVSTTDFGRSLPKKQPTAKAIAPSPAVKGTFFKDGAD